VTGFGFPGRYRLKKTDEFSSVFNFRKRISGIVLAIHYMPNTLGYPRLGVIVGKKTAKRAVQRNYMKRTVRELFRHEQMGLGAVDILVRPLKAYTHSDFVEVQAEFKTLLDKLHRRSGGS
jgi:ribonuclease P protein component